jgi:hypothetical protein
MPKLNAAFRKWFGRSEVAEPDGTPKVVYHGTDERFTTFDLPRVLKGGEPGFFFTDVPELAQDYGVYLIEAYLRIENPYVVSYWEWVHAPVLKIAQIKKRKHDGVILTDFYALDDEDNVMEDRGEAYIVFSPTQIKAVDNRGTWSQTDPDIRRNPRGGAYG